MTSVFCSFLDERKSVAEYEGCLRGINGLGGRNDNAASTAFEFEVGAIGDLMLSTVNGGDITSALSAEFLGRFCFRFRLVSTSLLFIRIDRRNRVDSSDDEEVVKLECGLLDLNPRSAGARWKLDFAMDSLVRGPSALLARDDGEAPAVALLPDLAFSCDHIPLILLTGMNRENRPFVS